jgi:phenylpyruvate tautomerase PptA (4-oxalocrotonate tautomerase family)
MPLVRISVMQGAPAGFPQKIGPSPTMAETIQVPLGDNFQILTEHDRDQLVYDPKYLGIARTDGVVVIQITLNEGRTTDMKKLFYRALAERLHRDLGVRMEDVFISLVEVKKENWSFGNGVAQYAA